MKVLDLQCSHGHTFEGWFGSEEDFASQCQRTLVQCPLCGDSAITKKLSAPRLHLAGKREGPVEKQELPVPSQHDSAFVMAWMAVAKHVVANSTDVGHQFAEEARKMHYGEAEERNIRGQTSPQEARALAEEGIEVMPLMLPDAFREPLQ
jgi:hypothetical protein